MILVDDQLKTKLSSVTFSDLFAGIGGFRLAFESFGARCVFSSEINQNCQRVYELNFFDKPFGDITSIPEDNVPHHDILCAGFPCQPFSISGKQKGFNDQKTGSLFFEIIRIAKHRQPKVILLENVKNYLTHDSGKTLDKTVASLKNIGYSVFHSLLNSSKFGIPQSRNRLYFVCFRNDLAVSNFHFPTGTRIPARLLQFCLPDSSTKKFIISRNDITINDTKLSESLFNNFPLKPIRIGTVNKGGQGERIYHEDGHAITLSSAGGGVGAKTGLYKINGKIRKLSPRECARISGFPDSFVIHPKESESYKQFGNTVIVDVIQHILLEIIKTRIFESAETQNKPVKKIPATSNLI